VTYCHLYVLLSHVWIESLNYHTDDQTGAFITLTLSSDSIRSLTLQQENLRTQTLG